MKPNNPKKVWFDDSKNKMYYLRTWNYAYGQARKGLWELEAIDRMRFQRRIDNVHTVLRNVLTAEHRLQVYMQRFA